MSASNWSACPRCTARAEKEQEAAMAKLAEAGLDGKFTLTITTAGNTFREDYEIYGATEGTVHVGYSGSCDKCGLRLDFSHDHDIPGVTE